jgi:hypothetical protein
VVAINGVYIMEETEDFSRKESKSLKTDKPDRIVPIPVKTTDTTIEEMPPSMDEEKEVIDVVKRRLVTALSRKLDKE